MSCWSCRAYFLRSGLEFPCHFRSHIMKQVLLSVSGVWSEMFGRESLQPLLFDLASRKIQVAQASHYPDVHRKRRLKPVGKKQYAISDLSANSRQGYEFFSPLVYWQLAQCFESDFTRRDFLRRSANVRRSESHLASPQFSL